MQRDNPSSPAPTTGTGLAALPAVSTGAARSLRRVGRFGILATVVAALLLGTTIVNTSIAGAVVTGGVLVVDSGAKQVQHPTGGVVAQILVHNGDRVAAGQPLVELDGGASGARLTTASTLLAQNHARLLRLIAERDGLEAPQFELMPTDGALPGARADAIIQTESDQFARRQDELAGELSQLDEQIAQATAQIGANEAELASVLEERRLLEAQLDTMRTLHAQQLVPKPRLVDAELAAAQAAGSEGRLRSAIASAKGKVAELKVTRIMVSRTRRTNVAADIAQVEASIAQLTEEVTLAREQVQRLSIVAPQDGLVHELLPLAPGAVVRPSETLMLIVPDHDKLVGEVKIRPADVDQLYPGQAVSVQFSAFERATTPAIEGRLSGISPDLIEEPRTGALHYTARIELVPTTALDAEGLVPVAGMPIEAFIKTEDRTILSYLVKPLVDQAARAFR